MVARAALRQKASGTDALILVVEDPAVGHLVLRTPPAQVPGGAARQSVSSGVGVHPQLPLSWRSQMPTVWKQAYSGRHSHVVTIEACSLQMWAEQPPMKHASSGSAPPVP